MALDVSHTVFDGYLYKWCADTDLHCLNTIFDQCFRALLLIKVLTEIKKKGAWAYSYSSRLGFWTSRLSPVSNDKRFGGWEWNLILFYKPANIQSVWLMWLDGFPSHFNGGLNTRTHARPHIRSILVMTDILMSCETNCPDFNYLSMQQKLNLLPIIFI